jgi:hypothetical protein
MTGFHDVLIVGPNGAPRNGGLYCLGNQSVKVKYRGANCG